MKDLESTENQPGRFRHRFILGRARVRCVPACRDAHAAVGAVLLTCARARLQRGMAPPRREKIADQNLNHNYVRYKRMTWSRLSNFAPPERGNSWCERLPRRLRQLATPTPGAAADNAAQLLAIKLRTRILAE
eukprot:5335110-Pleurochrysis_carterae.AAC.1